MVEEVRALGDYALRIAADAFDDGFDRLLTDLLRDPGDALREEPGRVGGCSIATAPADNDLVEPVEHGAVDLSHRPFRTTPCPDKAVSRRGAGQGRCPAPTV
jgi:hypothetical protein